MTKITLTSKDVNNDDGTYSKANGGTEMMLRGLKSRLPKDLLDNFNFICSRVRDIDKSKKNILWLHDTWNDPENDHMNDPESLDRFAKLVFVSNYQLSTYNMGRNVPYAKSVVLQNAIEPIKNIKKDMDGPIRLIYHTTPHRGLEILVPVFEHIVDKIDIDIELDVFSSFAAYGWPSRDEPYASLFERCKNHPKIRYHGYQPNEVVRDALAKAHIFAYPSIWVETSCIAAIEALSAGCRVICPNLGALPETTCLFSSLYHYNEDIEQHANVFANILVNEIYAVKSEKEKFVRIGEFQKNVIDPVYSWDNRIVQWEQLLRNMV